VLSERIDGVRELLDQRINDQTRLLKAEFSGLEAKLAHETGALRTEIGSVADRMETSLAHETEKLRTEIGGLEERIEARLAHETGTLRAEIAGQKEQIDTRLAHDFGAVGREFEAVRKEFKAVRAEIAGLKELLLGRMEQQEQVRAAEYAATKWSIRSLMAAMALLVAMMARFTLFQ